MQHVILQSGILRAQLKVRVINITMLVNDTTKKAQQECTNEPPAKLLYMQEEVTKQFYSHLPLALSQLTYTIAHNKH